jgi:hypothetical protein
MSGACFCVVCVEKKCWQLIPPVFPSCISGDYRREKEISKTYEKRLINITVKIRQIP